MDFILDSATINNGKCEKLSFRVAYSMIEDFLLKVDSFEIVNIRVDATHKFLAKQHLLYGHDTFTFEFEMSYDEPFTIIALGEEDVLALYLACNILVNRANTLELLLALAHEYKNHPRPELFINVNVYRI